MQRVIEPPSRLKLVESEVEGDDGMSGWCRRVLKQEGGFPYVDFEDNHVAITDQISSPLRLASGTAAVQLSLRLVPSSKEIS